MSIEIIAFAGRPWPVDIPSDDVHRVGSFESLAEACEAFTAVEFVTLTTLHGCLRWRGWSPQSGMIIQLERPIDARDTLPLAS